MHSFVKKYIFFIFFLSCSVSAQATEQALSLRIAITEDYISIGANGGFLPDIYYTKTPDKNGIRYVSRQKENTDVFDEVVEYVKLIRHKFIKSDSNDITLIVEPVDDAMVFSLKMQSYEQLIQKLREIGFTNISIFSFSGEDWHEIKAIRKDDAVNKP